MWVDDPMERLTLETMYSAFTGPAVPLPDPVTFQDSDPLGASIVPVVTSGDNMSATTQYNCKIMKFLCKYFRMYQMFFLNLIVNLSVISKTYF